MFFAGHDHIYLSPQAERQAAIISIALIAEEARLPR
jgi:hypothetical protein